MISIAQISDTHLLCPVNVGETDIVKQRINNLRKIFTQSLSEKFDKEYYIYSIELKGLKLISMDTFCSNSNKGELTSSKIKLLSNEISHSRSLPTAIFMHHPPYNVGDNEFERIEYVDIEAVKKFHYYLKNKSNIVALFCGHIHKNFESNIGHIKTFTMPSIATDLSWDNEISKKSKKTQYLLHSFSKKTGIYTKKILTQ